MQTILHRVSSFEFTDHPRFAGVRIAVLVSRKDSDAVSVSLLDIAPSVEIPVHTHDAQLDSIFVVSGQGEAFINGSWQAVEAGDHLLAPKSVEHGMRNAGAESLRLLVHHSPPLL